MHIAAPKYADTTQPNGGRAPAHRLVLWPIAHCKGVGLYRQVAHDRKDFDRKPVSGGMSQSREAKFDALVSAHASDLYRYALWLSRHRELAEDLVQETCMRAWKGLDQLRDPRTAKSWLFTILRHENARHHERVQPDWADDVDVGELPARIQFDTSTEAFAVRQAVARLSAEYREPLALQILGGFSCEEIAGMLDISRAAVMTRLFRARQQLRRMLQHKESNWLGQEGR